MLAQRGVLPIPLDKDEEHCVDRTVRVFVQGSQRLVVTRGAALERVDDLMDWVLAGFKNVGE